jgi:hypothetical protein
MNGVRPIATQSGVRQSDWMLLITHLCLPSVFKIEATESSLEPGLRMRREMRDRSFFLEESKSNLNAEHLHDSRVIEASERD